MPKDILLALILISLTACRTYRRPTIDYAQSELEKEAAVHPLYQIIPLKEEQIAPGDPRFLTWALFGNADAGIFAEYHPQHSDDITWRQFAWWTLRNPMHNLTFYVIGDADDPERKDLTLANLTVGKDFKLFTSEPGRQYTENSGLHLALHNCKPFLGLKINWPLIQKRTELYLGWRPQGNFGLTFRPLRKNQ